MDGGAPDQEGVSPGPMPVCLTGPAQASACRLPPNMPDWRALPAPSPGAWS